MDNKDILSFSENPQYTFTNFRYRNFAKIIQSNVYSEIVHGNRLNKFLIDREKIAQLLSLNSQNSGNEGSLTFEQNDAEDAFRQVVKSLVDHRIIDVQTATLTGKIVRPSDISKLENINSMRFLFLEYNFPDNNERGLLEMGTTAFTKRTQKLEKFLQQLDINLPPKILQKVVLRWLISHEYGHAVDDALILQKSQTVGFKEPNKEKWKIKYEAVNVAYKELFSHIAPEPELQKLFYDIDPAYYPYTNLTNTSGERIAVGFEYLGLKYSLTDSGIAESQVGEILDLFIQSDKTSFSDFKQVVEIGKNKNFNIEQLASLLLDLRTQTPELRNVLPHACDSHEAGYYFPLNQEQIKRYLEYYNN